MSADSEAEAIGDSSDIEILGQSVSLTDTFLAASNAGEGNAGNVLINTPKGSVTFDRSSALSATFKGAKGNGGNVEITTDSLLVRGGSQLQANTGGQGNGGSVLINALGGSVAFDDGFARSRVNVNAIGNGGNIEITTDSLTVKGGGRLFARNDFGEGNAGRITITAKDTVTIAGFEGNGAPIVGTDVANGGTGNGNDINIKARSIDIKDEAVIAASIINGKGKNETPAQSGDVNITATEIISVANNVTVQGNRSAIFSEIGSNSFGNGGTINISAPIVSLENALVNTQIQQGGEGKAGDINIQAGTLSVTNNAFILAATFGRGDAGNVTITATNTISFDNSFAANAVGATGVGNGGRIEITTGSLEVTNGARLDASIFPKGKGNAGSVTINANDLVKFDGDNDRFNSGAFTTAESTAVGDAGGVTITTSTLTLTNEGEVAISSLGTGNAGNLEISANLIELDFGLLNAQTSGGQGNINLSTKDIILRNESNITTDAFGLSTGGNIDIDTENLVAFPNENSDITANAEDSFGGRVSITADCIFGTEFREERTPKSDITATSELGAEFSGEVTINTPEVDPTSGLIELPEAVADASDQISQNACQQSSESEFIITGRGGLPPSPNQVLSSDSAQVGWIDPAPVENRGAEEQESREVDESTSIPNPQSKIPNPIVPARGWIFNEKGEVLLVSYDPTNSGPQRSRQKPPTCPEP